MGQEGEVPTRRYIGVFAFVFLNSGLFYFWYAFPLANTIWYDGLPQIGTSDKYVSARYDWDWWHVFLLSLNQLLPITLAWAVANSDVDEWGRVHRWLAIAATRVNIWVFLVLTVRWAFFCNTPFSAGSTACNDYRWCCVFFPNDWCPNNSVCNPNITLGDLQRNKEMIQHWAFSLVYFLLALWNVQINNDMREYGVLG